MALIFYTLRNWNISAHETSLFSREQTHIGQAHRTLEQNPNSNLFLFIEHHNHCLDHYDSRSLT